MMLHKGVVKWFNDKKGFGFIRGCAGKDIFFHYSAIEGEGYKTVLGEEIVYYKLSEKGKGPYASQLFRTYLLTSLDRTFNVCEEFNLAEYNPPSEEDLEKQIPYLAMR